MPPSRFPVLRPLFSAVLVHGVLHLTPIPTHATDQAIATADIVAPALLLAQSYSEGHVIPNYLVSEKLDGVRAYWDGKHLRFRSGRVINAPAWFIAPFPTHPLDGELWMGRRSFDRLSAAVRREEPLDEEWKNITYQLYELPGGAGTFSERIVALQESVRKTGVPWLQVLEQTRLNDSAALKQKLAQVVREGGEGLMLHRADAVWQTGRSDVLLKLKPYHDAEAVIVAHEPGKGKYEGMLGAVVVVTPSGQRFRLGTGFSDAMRRDPPPVGSTVTFRYRDLTSKGLPRFASFLRVRPSE